jgi:hypothetical protein
LSLVIEVSCGEYGDNIHKLVSAIQNGKHDIRTGQPLPELPPAEVLNNAGVKLTNGNGVLGANAVESGDAGGVKYSDSVNLYQPHVTKDVAKGEQGNCNVCIRLLSAFSGTIVMRFFLLSLIIIINYFIWLSNL